MVMDRTPLARDRQRERERDPDGDDERFSRRAAQGKWQVRTCAPDAPDADRVRLRVLVHGAPAPLAPPWRPTTNHLSTFQKKCDLSRNTEKSTFLYERIRLWDPGGLQGMCLYMLKTPRIIPLGSGRPELCSVKVRTFFEKRPTSNYGVAIRFLGRTAASGAHLGLYGLGTYHMLSM